MSKNKVSFSKLKHDDLIVWGDLNEATVTSVGSGSYKPPLSPGLKSWNENTLEPFNIPISKYVNAELQYDSMDGIMSSKNISTKEHKSKIISKELKNKIVTNNRYILVHQNYFAFNGDVPIDMHYWRNNARLDSLTEFQIIKINPSLSDNMMDYVDLIKGAEEIHCIASSFYHIVDGMAQETNARLFYHDIRKTAVLRVNNQWNNYRWTIINYSNKF